MRLAALVTLLFAASPALAARIALEQAPGSCYGQPSDVYPRVQALLTARGHEVAIVSGSDLDTAAKIATWDAIVFGSGSYSECPWDWKTFDALLPAYVQGGGGLVTTGWVLYYMSSNTHSDERYPGLESVLPMLRGTDYIAAGTLTPAAHEITAGLSAFSGAEYTNQGGGMKSGATPILTMPGNTAAAVWEQGAGRVAYLGPNYLANWSYYQNEPLLNGSIPAAQELFLRAVEWTASGCRVHADCPAERPICRANGSCAECSADNTTRCTGDRPRCDAAVGTCRGCLDNVDCTENQPYCDRATYTCRACALDAECPGASPRCDTSSGRCVSCRGDQDCGGTAPVCDDVSARCRPCAFDADCPADRPACLDSGACAQCSASNASRCSGAVPWCAVETAQCVGCRGPADCGLSRPWCDPAISACRACSSDAQCPTDRPVCQADGTCAACSATNHARCRGPTPVCDALAAACVACVPGGDPGVCAYDIRGRACLSAAEGLSCGCLSDLDCARGFECHTGTRTCQLAPLPEPDAGTPEPDAGQPVPDAGPARVDAGDAPIDAGPVFDAGPVIDAGPAFDAGPLPEDAGPIVIIDAGDETDAGEVLREHSAGCGCASVPGAEAAILGLVAWIARRRRGVLTSR